MGQYWRNTMRLNFYYKKPFYYESGSNIRNIFVIKRLFVIKFQFHPIPVICMVVLRYMGQYCKYRMRFKLYHKKTFYYKSGSKKSLWKKGQNAGGHQIRKSCRMQMLSMTVSRIFFVDKAFSLGQHKIRKLCRLTLS